MDADVVHGSQLTVFLSIKAIMNHKDHHTTQELKTLYSTEKDARLSRRIHGVYLAARGLSYTQVMTITGAARRTIQQWIHKYNEHRIDGLKDKPRPGQQAKLPGRDILAFALVHGMKRPILNYSRN